MSDSQSQTKRVPDLLVGRCEEASRLALAQLLKQRTESGTWEDRLDVNAFSAAAFVVMLRTTGAINLPGSSLDEVRLVRHMIRQTNQDGGFWKYPGSASSFALTKLVVVSLRLTLGDVSSLRWPSDWFRRNEGIEPGLATRIEQTIQQAEHFLASLASQRGSRLEPDPFFPAAVLTAYVDPSERLPFAPFLRPRVIAALERWPGFCKLPKPVNFAFRKSLPALAILCESARSRPVDRSQAMSKDTRPLSRSQRVLENLIRADQGESGGWVYSALYTSLNLMALCEFGAPLADPAIKRGLEYLRRCIVDQGNQQAFLDFMTTDIWDTAVGILAYLSIPGQRASDAEIVPAIEFLIRWQASDGGFAFGSGFTNAADTDSTALVVISLERAHRTADTAMRRAIADVLKNCQTYIVSKQDRKGGFPAYEPSRFPTRPQRTGFFGQVLLDQGTPDVTARSLAALSCCGLAPDSEPIRKGVQFLLAVQHPSGGWWSRWWSGYFVGTSMALHCLAQLGFSYTSLEHGEHGNATVEQAFRRALAFLQDHQNEDGGWGETIEADCDPSLAGIGESTPLHTSIVLWGLLASGYPVRSRLIQRGIEYLLGQMTEDGRWLDDQATFTVLSGSFYYAHPLFNYMLPMMCLGEFLSACQRDPDSI